MDLLSIRRGRAPNCSSGGSVIGLALISASAASSVLAFWAHRLMERRTVGTPPTEPPKSLVEFTAYWRNVFSVFIIFAAYLLALPFLGMLIGNIAFSFILLSALGGWRPFVLHGLVAIGTSGGMWLLFTYALEVFLPRGSLTGF